MTKPFKLKQRRKKGTCNAMRCKDDATTQFPNGVELCDTHKDRYDPDAVPDAAPAAAGAPDQAAVLATVQPVEDEAKGMLTQLAPIVVNSQATLDLVGPVLQDIKRRMKALEQQRTAVTKPMLDAKKTVDSWFKPAMDVLKQCEAHLKGQVAAFAQGQAAAQVNALQAGDHAGAMAVVPATMPDGLSQRTTYKWEVTDPSQVPADFLCVDAAKVQAVVNELKGAAVIPGITVTADVGVTVRT